MRIDRKVIKRKDQLLVAIPARVRDHLKLVGGVRVWWHVAQTGLVAFTTSGRVPRGRIRLDADCSACEGRQREIDRLRAKLQAQPAALFRQWRMQEQLKRIHLDLKGYPALDAINERLARIEDQVRDLRGIRPRRVRVRRPRPVEPVAALVLSAQPHEEAPASPVPSLAQ